jgi:hypothetical protein
LYAFMDDPLVKEIAAEDARRILCRPRPEKWISFCTKYKLNWKSIEFKDINKPLLPANPGMYCFILAPHNPELPPVAYPLYAGITSRTLRERFGEYVQDKNATKPKRKHVAYFLRVFDPYLDFYYTEVAAPKKTLEAIEKELNDALVPPINKNDFTAEYKSILKAFP